MTANGVTSEPVPEVVGIATIVAFLPSSGSFTMRLRISMNRIATSSKLISGSSYMSHMILAASIGLPPPTAMIASGWNELIRSSPLRAS